MRTAVTCCVRFPYELGRSKDWLKLKCAWEQEFAIGGYTDPAGSRTNVVSV
jgi:bifunctional non-homologous end joining protein LigD